MVRHGFHQEKITAWAQASVVSVGEIAYHKKYILTAILHREDNLYVVTCPEVGTVSQGGSVEEAVANLREATELYLEEFPIVESCDRPESR
jgi:predicted RNase H-like HicB family nuclease